MIQPRISKGTRLTPRLRLYLDAINDLHAESGRCKLIDVAHRLGVHKGTVHTAVRRLVSLNLIRANYYGNNMAFYEPAAAPESKSVRRLLAAIRINESSMPAALMEFKEVWQ